MASRGAIWGRRLVALGALAAVAIAVWLLSGGGSPIGGAVDERGADVEELMINSEAVGERLPVKVVLPDEGQGSERALLVFLHGRDGDADSSLDDGMFAALDGLGARAPAIAFPYCGDHSYWHDRADGDWARYVVEEVIPQVTEQFDLDPERVAVGGISMGGYGAYNLASSYPDRFCAVGGHSPALWATAGETAPGAFDDPEDFARNDVIAAAANGAFGDAPIWLDTGDEDPFRAGDEAFTSAARSAGEEVTENVWPGGHEGSYWASHWPDYLRFYSRALRRC